MPSCASLFTALQTYPADIPGHNFLLLKQLDHLKWADKCQQIIGLHLLLVSAPRLIYRDTFGDCDGHMQDSEGGKGLWLCETTFLAILSLGSFFCPDGMTCCFTLLGLPPLAQNREPPMLIQGMLCLCSFSLPCMLKDFGPPPLVTSIDLGMARPILPS